MMAKNKNNKILAMALCASVMAGIYASPVMAAEISVTSGSLNDVATSDNRNYTFGSGTFNLDGSDIAAALENQLVSVDTLTVGTEAIGEETVKVWNNVANNTAGIVREIDGGGTRTVVEGLLTVNKDSKVMSYNGDVFHVDGSGAVKAAAGKFGVDETGSVTATNFTTNTADLNNIAEKTAGISQHKWNTTYFNGAIVSKGNITTPIYNGFQIGTDKAVTSLRAGNLYLGDDENGNAVNLTKEQLANINATIGEGQVVNATEVTSTGDVVSSYGDKNYSLNTIGANTAGIDRTSNSKWSTTTIEDTLVVKSNGSFQNADESFRVNANGAVKAAGGKFQIDKNGNVTNVGTVDGVDVSKLNSTVEGTTTNLETLNAKTQNIDVDRTTAGTTTFTGNVDVDGTVINAQGINANSSDTFKVGQINVSGRNMSNVGYISGNTLNFKTINMGADGNDTLAQITADKVRAYNTAINAETGALTGADGSVIGGVEFSQGLVDGIDMSNLGGIEREELANGTAITTIEGVTSFDQSGMGIYTESGTTTMTGGQATFMEKDGSFTQIMGGAITAETLNGKDINDLVVGADIEDDLANVGGISRQQDENGVFYTNVEGTLTVSEKGLAGIVDDNAINLNSDGINLAAGSNAISITDAGIGFAGTVYTGNANDFHFTYNGFAGVGGTNIAAGNYTLSDLVDTVADIYDRTQGISYENGTTTVDGNLNVQGDASTGEGGNMNAESGTIGDVTMSDGNINTDGVVNAGSGTIGEITMENGNINTDGVINAGGGTIGDVTMSDGNINTDGVINAAGGGTIGGATVDKDGNINTDGVINAGGGTIGDVTMSNGAVTAGQTTVNNEGVSIANSTIISDHDVVINEGTDERVSLADVGNRVGNLEQSVSDLSSKVNELDDRIDKVGAMAAAIANLRTMGYDPAAPTEVAVGLGQYRDETGAALGLFHYPNRDFMLSLSVSTSGDEVMGGIGATWKFGRKSPEKVAEIKKAQAEADVRRAEEAKLAKAEEMKKAAKEAKIKAQQERHAKLAAERAAQAEAK